MKCARQQNRMTPIATSSTRLTQRIVVLILFIALPFLFVALTNRTECVKKISQCDMSCQHRRILIQ